ncbi:YchJ family protein [Alteromonas sp. D210916BOD_24]|uniref:YchJ family protein n=1 Tax=Alteromonas sp. D210916BOD_24 TaxID=3157618 RepID=UPI00399CCA43
MDALPHSAEQLMRSRFSAYALQNYAYILDTYAENERQGLSITELSESAKGVQWFALQINHVSTDTSFTASDEPDLVDSVEFTAYYFENNHLYQLHETSYFVKEQGAWRYRDGVLHDDCGKLKYGRNLPCLCGSGKKFKQCCSTKIR